MEIVAADIGGTNARFAIATLDGGRVTSLHAERVLRTSEFDGLGSAWAAYVGQLGRPAPRAAAIAIAAPVRGDMIKFTNSPWSIEPATLAREIGVDRLALVNDFAAVAHATTQFGDAHLRPLCGPEAPLPRAGVISVLGPGTGLGVAQLILREGGYQVVSTEGGHVNFAPGDAIDDAILARLRRRYAHVSAERLLSGPGLVHFYESLAEFQGRQATADDDKELWRAALAGDDPLAVAALERFCLCLGSCAGDIALAQGADAVAIAGGLGSRLADVLPGSGFATRFKAKGRFEPMMASLPVKIVTYPEPGLFGAAAAFAQNAKG